MSQRIVVYKNSNGQNKTYTDQGFKTWGELKQVLINDGLWGSNLEAVIHEGRRSLKIDSAELPSGDFTLYLVAQKMKSGNDDQLSEVLANTVAEVVEILGDTEKQITSAISSINEKLERLKALKAEASAIEAELQS